MKKKSTRDIPDFSRHTPRDARGGAARGATKPAGPSAPPPTSPRQTTKPQATSAKSGRRGQ